LLIALSLGFFKGAVEEEGDSDMMAEGKGWWRDELEDLERRYENVQGHMRSRQSG
jgi:hypothetical protein